MTSQAYRQHRAGSLQYGLAAILLATAWSAHAVAAATIVENEAFNIPSGTGPTSLTTDANGGLGPSAAKFWGAFNDTAGTTTTELLPSTLVPGGTMIHVTTTGLDSGLYQSYPKQGPTNVFTCAWIYINSGAVGIGSGDYAYTTIDATLYKTGSWEVLNVGNQSTPATTTVVYSQGNGVSDFYVESIQVSTSHAQCRPR